MRIPSTFVFGIKEVGNRLPEAFNLIITHLPTYRNYIVARRQVLDILNKPIIVDVQPNIMFLRVDDPDNAVESFRRTLVDKDTPILRVIPVDKVIEPYVEEVSEWVKRIFYEKCSDKNSFAIRMDGHLYSRDPEKDKGWLPRDEAIKIIASEINNPVNLSDPQCLIYIKIVQLYGYTELASLTIGPPSRILSIAKMKGY